MYMFNKVYIYWFIKVVVLNVLGFLGGLVDLNLEFLKRFWYIIICKIDKWKIIFILYVWFLLVLCNILDFEF